MNPGEVFRNNNGQDYTVLGSKDNNTLIAYDTELGMNFAVVEGISQLASGLYVWEQGHYYMEDIISAARYLDNPEREKARIQAENERQRREQERRIPEPGESFLNDNGRTYTVLERRGRDALLSQEVSYGTQYLVVKQIHRGSKGNYVWEKGSYFGPDKDGATKFFNNHGLVSPTKKRSGTPER